MLCIDCCGVGWLVGYVLMYLRIGKYTHHNLHVYHMLPTKHSMMILYQITPVNACSHFVSRMPHMR